VYPFSSTISMWPRLPLAPAKLLPEPDNCEAYDTMASAFTENDVHKVLYTIEHLSALSTYTAQLMEAERVRTASASFANDGRRSLRTMATA
jgi:hypothetical protein